MVAFIFKVQLLLIGFSIQGKWLNRKVGEKLT